LANVALPLFVSSALSLVSVSASCKRRRRVDAALLLSLALLEDATSLLLLVLRFLRLLVYPSTLMPMHAASSSSRKVRQSGDLRLIIVVAGHVSSVEMEE
jgi:hypothetical protein